MVNVAIFDMVAFIEVVILKKVAVLDMGGTINGILEPSENEPTNSRVLSIQHDHFSVAILIMPSLIDIALCCFNKGSIHQKKQNFMKKFHKTVTPHSPYCFYEILIQNYA